MSFVGFWVTGFHKTLTRKAYQTVLLFFLILRFLFAKKAESVVKNYWFNIHYGISIK